jgi:predicted secreted hydrolase
VLLAHFAVSDLGARGHVFDERVNRPGPGTASAARDSLRVVLEDWSAIAIGGAHRLRAGGGGFAIDLAAAPERPPVVHGAGGVSRKAREPGHASHYYSLTRLATRGTLIAGGDTLAVEGLSWMDHEFGSDQLARDRVGWDWVGLHLDDGSDLMVYRLRGSSGAFLQGTLVPRDGTAVHLDEGEVTMAPIEEWTSAATGARYPIAWQVSVPSRAIQLEVRARFAEQELTTERSTGVTYWEGSAGVRGTAGGAPIGGEGYLEMTGYARAFEADI